MGSGYRIPLCAPEIHGHEWKYIKECLDAGWVSSAGTRVEQFEQMVAQYLGVRQAVATVNGTAALDVALRLAGVGRDDEVVVSALTFIAPANAVRYHEAWPVFIDAEPVYWQMDPQKLADFLRNGCLWKRGALWNLRTHRRVRAILPVHILGHPVDLRPVLELAKCFDLPVVEDATEALGVQYWKQAGTPDRSRESGWASVGTGGDIACFSFNGNKIITTGSGGMIVTRHKDWARKARYLTAQAKDDPVEFVHKEVGYNYRLTNIQAAMGCAQMEYLDKHISAKRRIAAAYNSAFKGVAGLVPMQEAPWARSTWWLYSMRVDEEEYGMNSRQLMCRLAKAGIQSRPLWQPMNQSPAHKGSRALACPVAGELNRTVLSLPCSVGLSASAQAEVIGQVLALARKA